MNKIILPILILVLMAMNIFYGSLHIPAGDVLDILMGTDIEGHSAWTYIIWHSRIPQMFTALLCGAALAASGLMLQTAFRNPLAGPGILGIDSGANLGVAIVMLLLGGSASVAGFSMGFDIMVILAAMAGALGIMGLLLVLNSMLKNTIMLLVTGVIISYMTSSIISLLNFSASEQGVHAFVMWGMGTFVNISTEKLPLFSGLILCGLTISVLLIKPLDALLLGDSYARNLGVNTQRTRQLLLLATGILTATTTAFCGPVMFIGLATPHIARIVTHRAVHRTLLPSTIMMGASIALLCNLLCTLPSTVVLPLNTITPLIGAPVILWVIFRK